MQGTPYKFQVPLLCDRTELATWALIGLGLGTHAQAVLHSIGLLKTLYGSFNMKRHDRKGM